MAKQGKIIASQSKKRQAKIGGYLLYAGHSADARLYVMLRSYIDNVPLEQKVEHIQP